MEMFDPDLKAPYTNEFQVSVDHEVITDLRLGLTFLYKHNLNLFLVRELNADENWSKKVYFLDPGRDGEFGTDDDIEQQAWDLYLPDWQIGPRTDYYTNHPDFWRKYQALELILEKRMSNRWQLFGSVVFSKFWGTNDAAYQSTQGYGRETPNELINNEGRVDFDRPVVIKMQATYMLPGGINLSAYYRYFSGMTYTRRISFWAENSGGTTINAEPKGSRRQQSSDQFDLRVEKYITIGDFGRLGLFIDVFNALNSGYVFINASYHGRITQLGEFEETSNWMTADGITEPRRIKFGLRFTF